MVIAVSESVYSASFVNSLNDQQGNLDANINSNQGYGVITQGSNADGAANQYENSILRDGFGPIRVNDNAGNQEASLNNDQNSNKIFQNSNGNNNADKVKNDVATGDGDSAEEFDVANMVAKTGNTNGNTTVAQMRDNNNASNNFVNQQQGFVYSQAAQGPPAAGSAVPAQPAASPVPAPPPTAA